MRLLVTLLATAVALAVTPASAQTHDRDRPRADDRSRDETSGFHRYYGSGYYETATDWRTERVARERRDKPRRDHRKHPDR